MSFSLVFFWATFLLAVAIAISNKISPIFSSGIKFSGFSTISFLQETTRIVKISIFNSFFILYLLKVNRITFFWSEKLPLQYARFPFTKVWVILDLNAVPSKGDHPHLYK